MNLPVSYEDVAAAAARIRGAARRTLAGFRARLER